MEGGFFFLGFTVAILIVIHWCLQSEGTVKPFSWTSLLDMRDTSQQKKRHQTDARRPHTDR